MTKTWFSGIAVGFAACSLCAAQPAATALVTVDAAKELGPVKPMHTVNNGPSVKKPGGPVICGNFDWGRRFLGYCRDHDVPLDFFSWHVYATEPRQIADCAVRARKQRSGFPYLFYTYLVLTNGTETHPLYSG